MREDKVDDFNKETKSGGPGGYKCRCCGPVGNKRYQRKQARKILKSKTKKFRKEG